jgi:hypothetical protein
LCASTLNLSYVHATPTENLDDMFGEDLSGTTQALELDNLDNMFGEDLSARRAKWTISGEDLSATPTKT